MRSMRIGIDGGCWANQRGYGRYTRNLLSAFARREAGHEVLLFVDPATAQSPDIPPSFQRIPLRIAAPSTAAAADGRRSVRDLMSAGLHVARHRLDVFFYPSVYSYFPLVRPVPTLLAIHDVIAERHPEKVFSARKYQLFWRAKLLLALRQARMVLTVSDHARDGIRQQLKVPDRRLRTIIEAADPVFRKLAQPRPPHELLPQCALPPTARVVLYVGGLSPHKNLPVLIEAFRRISSQPDLRDHVLLLVGDYERDVFLSAYQELRSTVEAAQLNDRVYFTGYVADGDLVDLYNRAELLVLPSLEEGFGLPAFEAAACGAPVIVSENGPAAGLLGEGAWAFPPRDVDLLTEGLARLLRDPGQRQRMAAAALARSQELSWDRSAECLEQVLYEASGLSRRS